MTEKRFELKWRDTGEVLYDNETGLEHRIYSPDYRFHVRDMMNEFDKENKELQQGIINYTDEIHYLTDKSTKLEKKNKELKIKNDLLSDELEQAKAVINKKWSEYLKKKELSE